MPFVQLVGISFWRNRYVSRNAVEESETPRSIIAYGGPAEKSGKTEGEKEITGTRVAACHLNILFHACRKLHSHIKYTLPASEHFAQKTQTHTLQHRTRVPGAGRLSKENDALYIEAEREGEGGLL